MAQGCRRELGIAVAVAVIGTGLICGSGYLGYQNRDRIAGILGGKGTPTPTGLVDAGTATATGTATETSVPWSTATVGAIPKLPEKVKQECEKDPMVAGHYNKEFKPLPVGALTSGELTNWFADYIKTAPAKDPLKEYFKNTLGVTPENYGTELIAADDLAKFPAEKIGEDGVNVVFVGQAIDLKAGYEKVADYAEKFLKKQNPSATFDRAKFITGLTEGSNVKFQADGGVKAPVGFYVNDNHQGWDSFTFTNTVKFGQDAQFYKQRLMSGEDRIGTIVKFKKAMGDKRSFVLRNLVLDDYSRYVKVDGVTYLCPGSSNVPEVTPPPSATPTPTGTPRVTLTPGGPETRTPKPPTATPPPTETRRATGTPQVPESTLPPTFTAQPNPSKTPVSTEPRPTNTAIPRPPTATPRPAEPTATPGRRPTSTREPARPTSTTAPASLNSTGHITWGEWANGADAEFANSVFAALSGGNN